MKIYIAAPITGQIPSTVVKYFESTSAELRNQGYRVYNPMVAKESLGESEFGVRHVFKSHGYSVPTATDHAIFTRDKWMVQQSDIVYANLTALDDSSLVSIGTVHEIAWASLLGKQVIIAMGEGNIHRHAFVLEDATIIFKTHEEAMDYLKVLRLSGI